MTAPARNRGLDRVIARPLLIEEGAPPRAAALLTVLVTALLLGAGVWAGFTELRETAAATGQVMPAGAVHRVQHLEGGIIAEVMVGEGELVAIGQPLVRLDPTRAQAEAERLRTRRAALAATAERLRAFLDGDVPKFGGIGGAEGLVEDHLAALADQRAARARQRDVLTARLDRQQARLETLRDQRVHAARRVDLVAQEVDMRQRLATRGLSTRVDLLDVQRRQAEARDRLAAVEGDIAGTRAGIVEARATLSELDAKLMADASERLAQVRTDLAEVERSLMQVADRARRTRLTAPVDGVVKGVDKRTPGAVLQPGDTVLEIVPISDEMVAEVRLDPKDAGHVRRGHTARVEITAYDTARFGDLNGEVRHVSASTFQDKDGRPYYRAIVALEKPFVGPSPQRNPVLPGMVVRAKIATGTKTLLSYLTKPVSRGFDAAFTER